MAKKDKKGKSASAAKHSVMGAAKKGPSKNGAAHGTSGPATAHDAEVLIKLYDLRREPVMRKARHFMVVEFWPQSYEEFKALFANFGSEQNGWARQVLSYWDMAAAMVLQGAVHEELFFKTNGEPYFLYVKFRPFMEQLRKDFNPEFMSHIDELANGSHAARERVQRLTESLAARLQTQKAGAH